MNRIEVAMLACIILAIACVGFGGWVAVVGLVVWFPAAIALACLDERHWNKPSR